MQKVLEDKGRMSNMSLLCPDCVEKDKQIATLKSVIEEYKRKLETTTEVDEALTKAWNKLVGEHEKLKGQKGHEYQISQMLDKSLNFLEKKVEKADSLVRNPHKILFTKAKDKERK
jgi:hypothetical protein